MRVNEYDNKNITYLKIKDSEFEEAGRSVSSFCNLLNEELVEYINILQSIYDNSIKSGDVHDALGLYIGYVSKLENIAVNIGEKNEYITDSYLDEIDTADSFLYKKGELRDFSDEQYEFFKENLVDDWINSFGESLWDKFRIFIGSVIPKGLDIFGWKEIKDDLQTEYDGLKKFHRHAMDTIDEIFEDVKGIERKYGENNAGDGYNNFYTCKFSCIWSALYSVKESLAKLSEIIEPGKGRFTFLNIELSLRDIFAEMVRKYEDVMNIYCKEKDLTSIMIERFAEQYWSSHIFLEFSSALSKYINDIDISDAAMMVLFQMFDIAKGQIVTGGEYADEIKKEELLDIIGKMAESYNYDESDEKQAISDFKSFIKNLKKYTGDVDKALLEMRDENGKKLFDGRTKAARELKEFIKGLGGAEVILSFGEAEIEVIARAFQDYSKNMEILDALVENYPEGTEMGGYVKEVKEIYENSISRTLKDMGTAAADAGYDALIIAAGSLPPIKVVEAIKASIDTVGKLTGLGNITENEYKAMIYYDMYTSASSSYSSALEKVQEAIKNGNNSGEEYEKMLNSLKYNFDITKSLLVKTLNSMAEGSIGKKRDYYQYCAKSAQSMSIYFDGLHGGGVDIISYDEYCAMKK